MSGWRQIFRALAVGVLLAAAGCAAVPYDGGDMRGPEQDRSRSSYM